jgi:hypothetical protein
VAQALAYEFVERFLVDRRKINTGRADELGFVPSRYEPSPFEHSDCLITDFRPERRICFLHFPGDDKMSVGWTEVLADADLTGCVQDFQNVSPKSIGVNGGDPLTAVRLRIRLGETANPNGLQNQHESRMLRVWRYSSAAGGLISLALDRTLKRVLGYATRDHWCISIGLSSGCINTMKAPVIYRLVKEQLISIVSESSNLGGYRLALMWHVSDIAPSAELGPPTAPPDEVPTVNNVFRAMLADPNVELFPDPKVAPYERAYAHFDEHLRTAFNESHDHYLRFVEVLSIQ